ncbi:MAG: NYN domain-containing protein [Microcoleaceae cyanobacterium]
MPSSKSRAILLVDGYNIIGAWPQLSQKRDYESLEDARRGLTEALVNYSAYENLSTQIVFDAYSQNSPSSEEVVTPHVSVCYTGFGQTADTYIEKLCASLSHDLRRARRHLIVATSDRAQQLTVDGYGAKWRSAQELAHDVEAVARRYQKCHKSRKQSGGRYLMNSLDPKSQEILSQLRMGL